MREPPQTVSRRSRGNEAEVTVSTKTLQSSTSIVSVPHSLVRKSPGSTAQTEIPRSRTSAAKPSEKAERQKGTSRARKHGELAFLFEPGDFERWSIFFRSILTLTFQCPFTATVASEGGSTEPSAVRADVEDHT